VTVVRNDGVQGNSWKPSKRFWEVLLAMWVVGLVVAAITRNWWVVAAAVIGIFVAAGQRHYAKDKPR
jgi:hypothetical protein